MHHASCWWDCNSAGTASPTIMRCFLRCLTDFISAMYAIYQKHILNMSTLSEWTICGSAYAATVDILCIRMDLMYAKSIRPLNIYKIRIW